ncbi:Transthyretin-like family protein [Teladorsagia circumcincta]|uniref:Transthyretin-like family protein n=1 Tax=Teladorsagia circumcincta TaxID=45464 RepID=A0A2G9UWB1_TELCI|nr:Transthyretin-like family protein [Teladorsagia circumcincta]
MRCILAIQLLVRVGGGQPDVYDEEEIDASGTVNLKAELRGNSGGGFGNENLMMTIIHNCDGNRQLTIALPPSYYNQGIVAIKTFDLGTINLEARYAEGSSGFNGVGRGAGFGRGGRLGGFGQFGGLPQVI